MKKGDRVVLDMQNCPQLVIAHFAILRANAVVVPVNPMNRAEELKHYITDPDAKVAITTADLAAEIAKASDALPPQERLAHMIVTPVHRCLRSPRRRGDAMPDGLARLAADAPSAAGAGRRRGDELGPRRWTTTRRCRRWTWAPDDLARAALHQRHHRPAQGLHAPAPQLMHNAVASCVWGNGTAENVALLVVPMFHITGMVSVMHATSTPAPRW